MKKRCIAYRVASIARQRIQKRFRSHGNEPPKHSNSEERDNSYCWRRWSPYGSTRTYLRERIRQKQKANRSQKWSLYFMWRHHCP
jgi:hypothetical protein